MWDGQKKEHCEVTGGSLPMMSSLIRCCMDEIQTLLFTKEAALNVCMQPVLTDRLKGVQLHSTLSGNIIVTLCYAPSASVVE